ncbi:hypothetical protein ALO94_200074 [Pseudomonas syringae pv. spinaceae]|uniref:Uncharacterized protein n=1 Tax=Pseudomonas syringae pv. spinaceae TaxID=264459 RepID=A0A0Q0DJB1_PSESX|nr:hypothetical protein ALO94_200074 [Pseudomonas syringae pv. spinaceae]
MAGVWRGAARAGPDHVAPEPGPGADIRPAGRWRGRCADTGQPVATGTQQPAPLAGRGVACVATGSWATAALPAGRCRSVAGLRADPAVDGLDRAAAWRVARHLAEPAAQGCAKLLRAQCAARRQGQLRPDAEQAVHPLCPAVSGGTGTPDQHQWRTGEQFRHQGLAWRERHTPRPEPDLGCRLARGQYPDRWHLVERPAR